MIRLFFILLFLALLASPAAALWLMVSPEPRVVGDGRKLDHLDLQRVEALLRRNDPRRRTPGSTQRLTLSAEELNLMLRYGLNQLVGGAGLVGLHADSATLDVSVALPTNPLGSWVNVSAVVYQSGEELWLEAVRLGRLEIPESVSNWLLRRGDERLRRDPLYRALMDSVSEVQLREGELAVMYRWQPELVDQVRLRGSRELISPEERDRLLAYTGRIVQITANPALGRSTSLASFTGPLFAMAARRTEAGADAVEENRALLSALALYVSRSNVPRLLDVPGEQRYRPRVVGLTLRGRGDLAQHFVFSAALASAGGSALADAVGLSKELRDTTGGSGFSFTDLAADRAGVRFAEVATGPAAPYLQNLLALGAGESDFMPIVGDLPEFMGQARFTREYGSVESPAYQAVAQDIERRIGALPVHRL